MDEIKEILKEDEKEKKQAGFGAYHKNGRAGKPFLLPDTRESWEKKNKMLVEINLNQAIPWEEFKSFSAEIQYLYLQNLTKKYKVGMRTISRDLFGLGGSSLRTYAAKKGYGSPHTTHGSQKRTPEQEAKWRAFCGLPEQRKEEKEMTETEEKEPIDRETAREMIKDPMIKKEELVAYEKVMRRIGKRDSRALEEFIRDCLHLEDIRKTNLITEEEYGCFVCRLASRTSEALEKEAMVASDRIHTNDMREIEPLLP